MISSLALQDKKAASEIFLALENLAQEQNVCFTSWLYSHNLVKWRWTKEVKIEISSFRQLDWKEEKKKNKDGEVDV